MGKQIMIIMAVFIFSIHLAAGTPTLKTIQIDGDPSDWTEVLANSLQVTQDGDGSSMDPADCGTLSNDRDCPVGTVGRDLGTFAWTFDNSYIYIYQTRLGSSANVQDFWFYMDPGQDQMMDTGDFVLHVVFKGSNGSSDAELYHYTEEGTDPDPMVDTDGWADGYTMPGTLGVLTASYGDLKAGFSDGAGFETRVPWTDLGVPVGTGVFFHVSSSNSSNIPGQIDDNCGGPDGKLGTFGFYLVDISPDHTVSAQAGTTVQHLHNVENTGTFSETVNLSAVSSSGFQVTLVDEATGDTMAIDANGDGDFSDAGDYLNPAYDSDGDGYPDTDIITPNTVIQVRADITIPPGLPNLIDSTTITASVSGQSSTDSVTDITAIGDIQLDPDQDLTGTPGATINFSFDTVHYLLQDTIRLTAVSSSGWPLSFHTDPEGDGIPNTLMATDANGDGDFNDPGDFLDPLYDTDGDSYPDTALLDPSINFSFVATTTIPGGTPYDSVDSITFYAATTSVNNGVQDTASCSMTVRPRLSISPDHDVAGGTNYYGASGQSIFFPHTVINAFGSDDTANLSFTASDGATVSFWSDPDCDGSIADGSPIADTGILSANGGSRCIVAEVQIPPAIPAGTTVTVTVTATSQADPSYLDTVTDETLISYIVTFKDAIHTQGETFFSHCSTLHLKGYDFWPSDSYSLHYTDTLPMERKLASKIANGLGQFTDSYTFTSSDIEGSWEITVDDGTSTWDTIYITLEPDGNTNTLNPFSTDRARYDLTDTVSISSSLNNTNTGGDYENSTLETVIISGDSTLYYDGIAFQAYTGSEWSRTIPFLDVAAGSSLPDAHAFTNTPFPSPGVWQVNGRWSTPCGYIIAESTITFLVGTTLGTYSDATFSQTETTFNLHEPVFFSGDYYYPSATLVVAYYNASGNLITSGSSSTGVSGRVTLTQETSAWSVEGTVHAVVYLNGTVPPALYNPGDPAMVGSANFTLVRLPGLLRNDQYASLGTAIFIQSFPADPALDPMADLVQSDFKTQAAFPQEVTDLAPAAESLIFYELDKAIYTMRLTKESGKIVIQF